MSGSNSKATSNRPPIGKPPAAKPPKSSKDTRKSTEIGSAAGVIAKIKSEAEKSKVFLEKQAMLEEKRKQLSVEQALKNGV